MNLRISDEKIKTIVTSNADVCTAGSERSHVHAHSATCVCVCAFLNMIITTKPEGTCDL